MDEENFFFRIILSNHSNLRGNFNTFYFQMKFNEFRTDFKNLHENQSLFASTFNLTDVYQDQSVYDADGYLLYTQTTQSNLSLFNVSCESLMIEEFSHENQVTLNRRRDYTSSQDIHAELKKKSHRSTMIFTDESFQASTNTLQRWQGLDLLNIQF